MFGADISNVVDGKGRRSGKAARAADPRASDAASARGQDPTASSPPTPPINYYRWGYQLPDGSDVLFNTDGSYDCTVTRDPFDMAMHCWECEQFLPPMLIEPPKSTPLGVSWMKIMSKNLDRKIDEAARKERGEEADGDDLGEDGFRSEQHLINYKRYLQRQREAAAEKAEEREKESARKRKAREERRAERRAEREAEREADREAKREAREVKRSLGVRSVPNSTGFYSATVEVDGELCCLGTDFMSHAAATRDAAMVVHACGGVIPDGILSDADVDMADGFVHNPTFLVKQLREKRADLLDVKEVSLKVMLDAKFIKSGKSTLFITRYATRYVADLRDDGTIVYAGETYAGPRNWVNFIVNGSEWGGQAWGKVRYGKEDGPTLKQLRQAHVEGRSSDDVVAAKSKSQLHPDERPDKCSNCGESLFCVKRNRRNATKGPAGPGTLCAGCGQKFKNKTLIPDEDHPGKLKKAPRRPYGSAKKQKLG